MAVGIPVGDFPAPWDDHADMNGLKLANDVFGHLQGDELLTRADGNRSMLDVLRSK
ncbi:GGDEF domain-containing protein [Cohnella sp. CFH 77786]|uniref:GGDEF domain-containing protein n=1 Tax=Cohnella sp. CFH 77786 TaxID=2662265 RepID=UPI001C60E405|nr:GGDEF domain-containing protein [Cohnella sp. CFH 77786]